MVTFYGEITNIRNGVADLESEEKSINFEIPKICREEIKSGFYYEIGTIYGDCTNTEYIHAENISEIRFGDKIIYLKNVILTIIGSHKKLSSLSLGNKEIGQQCILHLIESNGGILYLDKGPKEFGSIYTNENKNIKTIIIDWTTFIKVYPKVVSKIYSTLKSFHPGVPIIEITN